MKHASEPTVTITAQERIRTSPLSLLFGYGAMAPFVAGVIAAAAAPEDFAASAARLTILWGCAILVFLSGVRRGLSFRTPGGTTAAQIATMLCLFLAGFAALAIEMLVPSMSRTATALLIIGYVMVMILDPIAAKRGEVPPFFARLRPLQMLIPVLSLLALLIIWSQIR